MPSTLIRNALIVNEGQIQESDLFIENGRIAAIGAGLRQVADHNINAQGCYLLPGAIDDQVHFREPGLTHKADLYTESRAAVAGGITSYMEMPNTQPPALTQELLEAKYTRAAEVSMANYSFFMGTSNDNLEEVLKTDAGSVCGIKVFMGSSTGNMLVDDDHVLAQLFKNTPMLIATHCEKEEIIRANLTQAVAEYGENIPIEKHPEIRSAAACTASSRQAIELAQRYNTRLHILHISTAEETALFSNTEALEKKRITAEACIHHLWFSDADYAAKGALIKWNPAVKSAADREAIRQALKDGRIDVVATDHAPHTLAEKALPYRQCPSGAPMVQHALPAMLELASQGVFSIEEVVEKMCHNPAICFRIEGRGFIREGYAADLVLVRPGAPWTVSRSNLWYKCGWSPLEGQHFSHRIESVWVNGSLAFHQGIFDQALRGERLRFKDA